ncbi:hypothetical protein [Kribbella shirazensis]|uniref:Endonuclease/exonuclease/phosphatase family protein n=1 Tax=Kribbella shirazensis TaxID=1105143 RepID=A0A7X5V5Q6_9ACTN|nr:hypothetical protein [Kribbella shirazensis]NIK55119.1 hypothetical protein [Kribbella shirazensis]
MTNRISRRQALMLGGGALAGTLGSVAAVHAASAAEPAEAGTAAAGTDWFRLPIITANIGRKRLGAREAAIRAVRNGDPGHRPLVGWQEISEGDSGEPAMISRHFGPNYRNAFLRDPGSFRVPISVPRQWKILASKRTFVHGGIAHVTPPRWINEVMLEHVNHPGLKFALINSHYIANAYNGDRKPHLRDEWDRHKKLHRERVLAHHAKGHLVIWTADTNNPNYDRATGQDSERKVFANGIDRINWLPGDGKVRLDLLGKKIIPLNVDGHDARLALFRIRLA